MEERYSHNARWGRRARTHEEMAAQDRLSDEQAAKQGVSLCQPMRPDLGYHSEFVGMAQKDFE